MIRFINNRNALRRFRVVLGMSLYKHWKNRIKAERRFKEMVRCMKEGKPLPLPPRRARLFKFHIRMAQVDERIWGNLRCGHKPKDGPTANFNVSSETCGGGE